jgi:hypothetical protein
MSDNLEHLCAELENLDQVDAVTGANCRAQAQEVLANPSIGLRLKTLVADLLMQANQRLVLKTVGGEDSY